MAGLPKQEEQLLTGTCPDEQCGATLFFPQYDSSIECMGCGQRLSKSRIKNIQPVTDHRVALHNVLKNIILGKYKPKKGADSIKVLGVSNYQCKLLSPLLTKYGMDKTTGKAKALVEMQEGKDMFDCSILAGYSFVIEPEHIEVMGYGRDRTGSTIYLSDVLRSVTEYNNNQECLIPIHADGDGHCLVHAISRALIGRELFWHALRENLKDHLLRNLNRYKALFTDFVQDVEWQQIIAECDPKYKPLDGDSIGLGNIHIFGLANVLRRPIILLDSLSGIQSSGDYSGVFLPGLYPPEDCMKAGVLNKPLCLAWSSAGRNHYIALVGVKGQCLPRLPPYMIPKVYGMPQSQLDVYIQRQDDGSIVIGGDRCLNDKYILRLIAAMEELFFDIHKVSTSCVADVHQYIYKPSGYVGIDPDIVLEHTQRAVASKQLFRCLTCEALSEHVADPDWFRPGGLLYKLAIDTHKSLDPTKLYSFPVHGYICKYNEKKNELVPDLDRSQPPRCQFCQGTMMRHVRGDGSPIYINGDRTKTRSKSTYCQCGYKHYWNGKEYDNLPEMLLLSLDWAGRTVRDTVEWFQNESDPTLNSNVYEVAQKLVEKHFPGEFGSEQLVQKVVDTILHLTANKVASESADSSQQQSESQGDSKAQDQGDDDESWSSEVASKIIITRQQSKPICEEKLTKSNTESELKKRIEVKTRAAVSSSKTSPKQQSQKQEKAPSQPSTSGSKQTTMSSANKDTSTTKKVRISTSDRRSVTVNLDPRITYGQLQDVIYQNFNIPREQQRIKCGFPPKLLCPPADVCDDQPLDIQHGDKLTVDIINWHKTDQVPANKLTDVDLMPAQEEPAPSLLPQLDHLQTDGQNSPDAAISYLYLMASLTGQPFWNYVQAMPQLFSPGGVFYKQAQHDVGLSDGKHYTLSTLPGKRFRYNAKEDLLELCLEPYGHYRIEPGIEKRILKADSVNLNGNILGNGSTSQDLVSSGSSGRSTNKPRVFPGEGHSLMSPGRSHTQVSKESGQLASGSENVHMSDSQDMLARKHSSEYWNQRGQSEAVPTDPGKEELGMDLDKNDSMLRSDQPQFTRIGPGVTVLSHDITNAINKRTEMFQALASQIESMAHDSEVESDPEKHQVSLQEQTEVKLPSSETNHEAASSEPMDST